MGLKIAQWSRPIAEIWGWGAATLLELRRTDGLMFGAVDFSITGGRGRTNVLMARTNFSYILSGHCCS